MDSSNPMFRTQKIMMYGMPVVYLFMGSVFQIGVLVYWVAGNIWNMGQQAWFIRHNPTPGSQAYREREKRLREKRRREGLSGDEIAQLEAEEARKNGGQRVQPLSKERAKKAGIRPGDSLVSPHPADRDADESGEQEEASESAEVRGKDGLTDAERARKRYERRQAERARSRAKQANRKKRAQQNQKKRNF